MAPFLFHRPRFLRSLRSSAAKPHDTEVSHSPGPILSPALSADPSSSRSVHEQDVVAARQPSSPGRCSGDRVLVDSSGHGAQDSLIDPIEAKSTQIHRLVPQPSGYLSGPPNRTDSAQLQVPPHSATLLSTPSQPSLNSYLLGAPGQYLPRPQPGNPGMFSEAHHFSVTGTFIDGNVGSVTNINVTSNQFMEKLLKETIPGAAFDSSARDPPPRCHPGTRLAVLERCLAFIGKCDGEMKMRWVFGAAGVGKSAIMQSVAESPDLPATCHASVFFSVNGRNDGTKAIKTISYQFAAKSESYRQVIEQEITRDPSLLQASMAVQFKKLIVEPFMHNSQLNYTGRILVIIDGLDECKKPHIQQELLRLISNFCITYPSSPIVWLIASRPEPHIFSFFSKAKVAPAFEKEEILVDSDEAREDVERFLRHELTEIKEASDSLNRHSQWPEEPDFWKIADAAGGLFAYADTAVKYIGDSTIGDPASHLSDVLHVIDNHPMDGVPHEEQPMALLDLLYARILSHIPSKIMVNARKILVMLATNWTFGLQQDPVPFIVLCNWLAMTPDEAYAAINHLRSVLLVPRHDQAHEKALVPFHKSFLDYITDFNRSRFSDNIIHEAEQLATECAFRVLEEAPNGIGFGETDYLFRYGTFGCGPGIGDTISLTWPVDEGTGWSDLETRRNMYKLAIGEVVAGVKRGETIFQSDFCICVLVARFNSYGFYFPRNVLGGLVFEESRRHHLLMNGILKQIPLGAVDIAEIDPYAEINLRFRRPATPLITFSGPWNPSCDHSRGGEWEEGKDQDWVTSVDARFCSYCFKRFENQMDKWKTRQPDHTVTILPTSTGECPVEIKFVYMKDGVRSEWIYTFWFRFR